MTYWKATVHSPDVTVHPAKAKSKPQGLEFLIPYRDLVLLVGFVLLTGGLWWVYRPVALIVAGLGLMAASLRMRE